MKYLKKTFFVTLLFVTSVSFSQIEPKFDVLGTIFGMPVVKGEYIINESFGVELSFNLRFGKPYLSSKYDSTLKQHGGGFKIEPRFYLSPDYDGDGYYLGLYFRNQSLSYDYNGYDYDTDEDYIYTLNNKFSSLGVVLGYKYYFDSGITLDYGAGIGRFLSTNFTSTERDEYSNSDYSDGKIDYYFTFGLGYRFDWGPKDENDSGVDEF